MGKIDVRGIMITGLLCASPLLVAANGCHCGAGDVPLGANRGLVADRSVPTIDGTATGGSAGEPVIDGTVGTGGTGGTGEPVIDGSVGTGGTSSSDTCFSPQNFSGFAFEPDSVGCACSDGEPGRCLLDSKSREWALACFDGRWGTGVDGACHPGFFSYFYCGLPQVAGTCENVGTERFWFNPSTGECESFQFHCGGNENNFLTKHECEVGCKFKFATPCNTPPNSGACTPEATPAFYYDPGRWSCYPFVYRGCDSSPNVFPTEADCLASCRPDAG